MLDQAELRAVTRMFNSPEGAAFEAEVRALLYRGLIAHRTPVAVFETMVITGTRIADYEDMKRQGERGAKTAASEAAAAGKAGDRKTAKEKHLEQESWQALRFLGETAARALRSLNDAVAWRALQYDRATVDVLVAHRPTGGLVPGAALFHELETMAEEQALLHPRYYVLWNDATNVLRHGDYTVVERDSGMVVDIQEVTIGSTTTARKKRQAENLDKALRLATGESIPQPGGLQQKLTAPGRPQTEVAAIGQVIDAAARQHLAAFAPQPYFGVTAIDLPGLSTRPEAEALALIEEAKTQLGSVLDGESVVQMTSYLNHVGFPRNAAPWAVFPATPAARARVIGGAIEVTCYFNYDAWFEEVHRAGWRVWVPASWPTPTDYREVPRIEKGPLSMQLSASILGRMTIEGLSPSTVMSLAQWLSRAQQSMQVTVGFEEDWRQWD